VIRLAPENTTVGKLCDAFLNNERRRPIVKLDVSSFKSKEYGKVDSPAFQVIGFEEAPAEEPPEPAPASAAAEAVAPPAKKTTKNKKSAGGFDDKIPF
jgi:hypothetical protein